MNNRRPAFPRPRALVVAVAALLAWASIAAVASAAPAKKTFTTSLNPSSLIAGHTYTAADTIAFTLTNTSTSVELGSVNVTVPTGVLATAVDESGDGTATLVGTVIELRDLALSPNESKVVSVSAQVECASLHAPYRWTTLAKQSNNFLGTGNDLNGTGPTSTISGTCGLDFSKQPKSAEKSPVEITNAIYNPDGDDVTVTVRDGAGTQTVSWWSGSITLAIGDDPTDGDAVLTGGGPTAVSGGSATFAPSISDSAAGYSLVPSASPTAGSPSVGTTSPGPESDNFNIVDDATICAADTACSATAGQGKKTSATVDASATGGNAGDLVILAINPLNDPIYDSLSGGACQGYNETSDVVVFDVTDSTGNPDTSNRSKIATLTLAAADVTKSASKYQVCYSDGVGNPSLLEKCDNQSPVPPCVVSKAIDQATKNLVIVVSLAPGDPGLKW